jgi:3-methyl-2-oxobutanoate hydroxymethyltransferase
MRQQAQDEDAVQELLEDALALEDARAFAIVLEAIPDVVAQTVTDRLKISTIGIGAGPYCDGQVLVSYDMLGIFDTFVPPFVKQYAQLGELIVGAAKSYTNDVRLGKYPQSADAKHANGIVPPHGAPRKVGDIRHLAIPEAVCRTDLAENRGSVWKR